MVDGLTRDRDPIFDGMVYENVKFNIAGLRLPRRKLGVEATVSPFLAAVWSFERSTFLCRCHRASSAPLRALQCPSKAQQYAWVVLSESRSAEIAIKTLLVEGRRRALVNIATAAIHS